jgi:hypothetical protein
MDQLTKWVQENPYMLSALYGADADAIAALSEYLGATEEAVSACVAELKDQNDILVNAISDGTDVLGIISGYTSQDAAQILGVDAFAIDIFGIKLSYVSNLLSEAMEQAEENDQMEQLYDQLGRALADDGLLAQLADEYDVEPAVLGALLESVGIEAVAEDNKAPLTIKNVELDIPDGVNDSFTYQIFLWTTNSDGTIKALTGGSYGGGTFFYNMGLSNEYSYAYQLPYNEGKTTNYGYATVVLYAGESVTISLPEGCGYMILLSASANYYVKNVHCTYGTVNDHLGTIYVYNASGANEIECVNDYAPNSLRISEEVMSSDPDSVDDEFTFVIYLYKHGDDGDTPLFSGDTVEVEVSTDALDGYTAPVIENNVLKFETRSPNPEDPTEKLPGLSVTGTYNVAEVTLKHGQSIVLKNLGKGYGCYVYQKPETQRSKDEPLEVHYMLYYLMSRHVYDEFMNTHDFVGSYSGHYNYINVCNVSSSVGFVNAQETLSITKEVEGSDTTRDFVFNVYFLQYDVDTGNYSPLTSATFPLSYTNPTGDEPTTVEIKLRSDITKEATFTDYYGNPYTVQWSAAQIHVAAGQTVTIERLPAAIAYFIEEVPTTNYTLTGATTTANGNGGVKDNYNVYSLLSLTDEAATFTNTYTPPDGNDLTISKTVSGNLSDKNQQFSFDITLTDEGGNTLGNQDIQVLLPGASADTIYATDENGKITVNLKHGQQVTLENLPKGTKYTITETNASEYTTTFAVTGGSYSTPKSKSVSGAMDDGTDVTVDINNNFYFVVPTGIRTDTEPLLLLLALPTATLLLIIVKKRRNAHR